MSDASFIARPHRYIPRLLYKPPCLNKNKLAPWGLFFLPETLLSICELCPLQVLQFFAIGTPNLVAVHYVFTVFNASQGVIIAALFFACKTKTGEMRRNFFGKTQTATSKENNSNSDTGYATIDKSQRRFHQRIQDSVRRSISSTSLRSDKASYVQL